MSLRVVVAGADAGALAPLLADPPPGLVVTLVERPAEDGDLAALAVRDAVVIVDDFDDAAEAGESFCARADNWLRQGAEDVLRRDELGSMPGWRRLAHAALRHHRNAERLATAFATDPATGLAHRRQFIEHLSQLLALRERDPSAMAVLALRVEWLPPAAHTDILRRKAAVRLRAAVRAGDVVAADDDAFLVLLGTLLDAGDANAVAVKLCALLAEPYAVAAGEAWLAVAAGVVVYPADGNQADRLVRRALALAAAAPALAGAQGAIGRDASGATRDAANDA